MQGRQRMDTMCEIFFPSLKTTLEWFEEVLWLFQRSKRSERLWTGTGKKIWYVPSDIFHHQHSPCNGDQLRWDCRNQCGGEHAQYRGNQCHLHQRRQQRQGSQRSQASALLNAMRVAQTPLWISRKREQSGSDGIEGTGVSAIGQRKR